MKQAVAFRERVFTAPYYRFIYGEGDGLPGLVIDRFADYYVCEVNTAGMEQLTSLWMEALITVMKPAGVLLKNNKGSRVLEELPCYQEVKYGEIPERIIMTENHVKFHVNLLESQKTGWYYDQRDNRARLNRYCRDQSVLDVYSYTGSFGLYAASYGAEQVTCIDSSEPSCRLIKENAILNNCADRVSVIEADAVLGMKQLLAEGKRFDVVLIDPPAFIKKRKDIKAGLTKYFQVNGLAARLVKDGGILVTSSCSMHLLREDLLNILKNVALQQKRSLQILEHGYQGIDHPISPFIPETEYLTTIVARFI
jgi:23S rRNA (cytosine1962-C5)-methyltransferase